MKMKMKKKKKKVLALFLSIAMILSVTPAFAELSNQYDTQLEGKTILTDVTNDEDIPMISLVYLSEDDSGNLTESTIPSEGLQENDVFLVAIKATNFKKYVAMKDNGLDSLTVSVAYDNNYIEPMFLTSSGAEVYGDDSKYITNVQEKIAANADSFINKKAMNKAGKREVAIYNDLSKTIIPNIAEDVTGGVVSATPQTVMQIGITSNPAGLQTATDIVKGAIDTEYLAILSFLVYTPPTDPTRVLALSTRAADMSISLASSPATQLGYNNGSIPWEKFLRLSNAGGDIFPAPKEVKNISATGTLTSPQYVGIAPNTNGITIKKNFSDDTSENVAASDVTYGVGVSSTDKGSFTALPSTWSSSDVGTKYIWAKVGEMYCYVGSITVQADAITGLVATSGTYKWATGVTTIEGKTIGFDQDGTKVTPIWASGKTATPIALKDFATNGIAIYHTNAAGVVGAEVQATDTFTRESDGKDYFLMALKSDTTKKTNAAGFSVAQAAVTTYTVSTQPKKTYTYPDTLDVTSTVFTAHNSQEPSINNTTKTYAQAVSDGIIDTIKINGTTVNAGDVLPATLTGKTIDFYKGTTLVASSEAITVNKKQLTVSFAGSVAARTYNGAADKSVPTGITPSVTTVNGDAAITVPAITYSYADGNKGDNKAITAAWTTNAGTFDNYTLVLPTGGATGITGNITAKDLNPTLVVTVSQNNAQVGDYTLADAAATISSSDKLAADTVNVTVSGTIAEADIKAGGNGKTVNNPQYKVDNTNYVIGTATITANVTNLPVANDLDADTKAKLANQTMKASDANNTEDYLITKLANLPTTGQSNIAGNDGKVNIAWTVDKVYTAKGTKYTYTGKVTAADPSKITANISDITVEVTVDAVNITQVTVQPITAKLGDTAPTLPTSGTTTGDVAVPYTITWVDGEGNPVTELKTDAILNATYTGTVTYDLTGKEWATEPTDKTVTLVYTVNDKDKTVINSVEAAAEVKVNAADSKNTETDIASLLPATIKAKDANGNDVELAVTWATTDTYNIKGGEYTYTATFTDEVLADYDVSAITDPITVKLNVAPVKANYDPTMFDQVTKAKNSTVTKYEDLGFITKGNATLVPAVEGLTVEYTVGWEAPSGVTFENVTKTAKSYEYKGTVSFKDAPAWLTLPETLTGTKTLKVQESEVSSGRGSASRSTTYAVTFSAGAHGTIVSGKRSITVTKDKVVTELPVVEAKEGYKFLGWSQDGGKTVINVEETPIIKTTTLTAVYEEIVEETPAPTATPLVNAKYTKPYASGYDGDVFLPENNITRAELATMIARLINGDDIADGSYRASFSDIPADAWYSKYVGYLESFGVLDGYEEDGVMVFKPEQTITRAEMAAVITRAQKYAVDNSDSTFWDVANDYWAKDYITTLAGKGIITGYADGSFGAVSPLTRAEAVVIINRLLDPSTAIVTFEPVDISGHWAEQEIILAVNERQVNGTEVEATPEPEETPAPEATADPEATSEPEADATAEPTATPAA